MFFLWGEVYLCRRECSKLFYKDLIVLFFNSTCALSTRHKFTWFIKYIRFVCMCIYKTVHTFSIYVTLNAYTYVRVKAHFYVWSTEKTCSLICLFYYFSILFFLFFFSFLHLFVYVRISTCIDTGLKSKEKHFWWIERKKRKKKNRPAQKSRGKDERS